MTKSLQGKQESFVLQIAGGLGALQELRVALAISATSKGMGCKYYHKNKSSLKIKTESIPVFQIHTIVYFKSHYKENEKPKIEKVFSIPTIKAWHIKYTTN